MSFFKALALVALVVITLFYPTFVRANGVDVARGTTPLSACGRAIATAIDKLPGASSEHVPEIARAIEEAGPSKMRAARLIAIGYSESRFLPRIQLGDCRRYVVRGQTFHECDAGKARSFWQMQATALVPLPIWQKLLGLEPATIEFAARHADRILERGVRSCKTEEGAAAFYARSQCKWLGGKKRAALVRVVARKLEACGT